MMLDSAILDDIRMAGGPDLLSRVVAMFLKTSPAVLQDIASAVEQKDAKNLERTAHRLKGSCLAVGAFSASTVCRNLEMQGRGGNLDQAPVELRKLEVELHEVRDALSALISTGGLSR